jgi:hypothetical protein
MRIVFGVLSLLVVVAIVGVLAKKQLSAVSVSPASDKSSGATVALPAGTPKQQVQQFQKAAEAAVQQARPMPSDDK